MDSSNSLLLDQFNFEGRYDLVKFIREIHAQGLYVSLRIGPFIESERKYGYESMKCKISIPLSPDIVIFCWILSTSKHTKDKETRKKTKFLIEFLLFMQRLTLLVTWHPRHYIQVWQWTLQEVSCFKLHTWDRKIIPCFLRASFCMVNNSTNIFSAYFLRWLLCSTEQLQYQQSITSV